MLQATSAQAQSSRFGSRAGSRFTGDAGEFSQRGRGPYRHGQQSARRSPANQALNNQPSGNQPSGNQPSGNQPLGNQPSDDYSADFDYRLEADSTADASLLDGDDFVDQAGFFGRKGCDCGDNCCCGDGVEPGCGCDDYSETSCGLSDGCCGDSCCGDGCCGGGYCDDSCSGTYGPCCNSYYPTLAVGFEWSFVKPRFSENVAFTTLDGDNLGNAAITDTEFDYDLELSPRLWVESAFNDQWCWRATYWQFDQSPATETASPAEDNFDVISHPPFGTVDISANVMAESLTASSDLNAYSIDIEAMKRSQLRRWTLEVGGGVRYASVQQGYFAQLRNATDLIGQIDYTQELEGFGPTMSLAAKRRLAYKIQLIAAARASVLYGDGSSSLVAREDINLTEFGTTRLTNREDMLTIGEARIGLEWLSPKRPRGWQWLLTGSMEGQVWGNAGNASSENADLGFFGFNVGAGFLR